MTQHDDPVGEFLRVVEAGDVASCTAWADDVVLDATVPNWRLEVSGRDAVLAEYSRWFADPGTFTHLRRLPVGGSTGAADGGADGGDRTIEVVEYDLAWVEDGVDHLAHHVQVLEVADGAIVADTVVCGGRWPAPLVAEMDAARNG
ncbi:MAG: hypothetical protein U0Q07_13060 [Acidimicrobiales bacterium]